MGKSLQELDTQNATTKVHSSGYLWENGLNGTQMYCPSQITQLKIWILTALLGVSTLVGWDVETDAVLILLRQQLGTEKN